MSYKALLITIQIVDLIKKIRCLCDLIIYFFYFLFYQATQQHAISNHIEDNLIKIRVNGTGGLVIFVNKWIRFDCLLLNMQLIIFHGIQHKNKLTGHFWISFGPPEFAPVFIIRICVRNL